MKQVILEIPEVTDPIALKNIHNSTPIFAKKNNKLVGMIANTNSSGEKKDKWILLLGGIRGATGYHSSRRECIESCLTHNYEFFIEN